MIFVEEQGRNGRFVQNDKRLPYDERGRKANRADSGRPKPRRQDRGKRWILLICFRWSFLMPLVDLSFWDGQEASCRSRKPIKLMRLFHAFSFLVLILAIANNLAFVALLILASVVFLKWRKLARLRTFRLPPRDFG